jgi:hypothetical protein
MYNGILLREDAHTKRDEMKIFLVSFYVVIQNFARIRASTLNGWSL